MQLKLKGSTHQQMKIERRTPRRSLPFSPLVFNCSFSNPDHIPPTYLDKDSRDWYVGLNGVGPQSRPSITRFSLSVWSQVASFFFFPPPLLMTLGRMKGEMCRGIFYQRNLYLRPHSVSHQLIPEKKREREKSRSSPSH